MKQEIDQLLVFYEIYSFKFDMYVHYISIVYRGKPEFQTYKGAITGHILD